MLYLSKECFDRPAREPVVLGCKWNHVGAGSCVTSAFGTQESFYSHRYLHTMTYYVVGEHFLIPSIHCPSLLANH